MSENTPQPAAPQQPQFTQQAPAAQPAHGAPVEAPKKKKWAAVTALVLGIISALTGFIILGAFTAIPTVIFAIIALVMVKRGTGKGKVMREQAGGRHLLEHKSSKKTRSIANDVELAKPDAKKIKKLLGK